MGIFRNKRPQKCLPILNKSKLNEPVACGTVVVVVCCDDVSQMRLVLVIKVNGVALVNVEQHHHVMIHSI